MKSLKQLILQFLAILFVSALPMIAFGQFTNENIQYLRPYGQNGINVFEAPKETDITFEGAALKWGAAFTQQWQSLTQSTDGIDPATSAPYTLEDIGPGFNLATANLNLDAQLADGIRVNVVTYLSSRHHTEAYVKGGYLQADKLPMFHSDAIDELMQYVRLRVGHFEVNYGDGHFRRTDNANAIYNPFVGNYLMDSFTTEVGGEAYFMDQGILAMLGVTGGQLHPGVANPDGRAPSVYGKLGYDNHAKEGLRFRLTGSVYHNNYKTHLYHGDRAGSRFYDIMDGGAWSGRVEPDFSNGYTSFMINPFLKYEGLEIFGLYENTNEMKTSGIKAVQYSIEGIYRFGADEQLFIGAQYNNVKGNLSGADASVDESSVDRVQLGGGWFMTNNILMKLDYVNQNYNDFGPNSLFDNAQFDGVMIEAVIAF
ncbi:MAG: hypothetical protein PVH63_01730 [Balneolaceae bacterium]|jgi:hypothetical protein